MNQPPDICVVDFISVL